MTGSKGTTNAAAFNPAPPVSILTDRETFRHYLPIPNELFRAGIYVTGAGRRITRPGEAHYSQKLPPAFHQFTWEEGRIQPDFSFLLIEAGSGIFESRPTGQIELCAGMVFMMFPGVWHRFRPVLDLGWTISWMSFNGEFAHLLLDQNIISPGHAVIHPTNPGATQTAIDQLLGHVHADPSSNSLQLSLYAIGVLATLGDLSAVSSPKKTPLKKPPPDPVVAAAVAFIWTSSHRGALSVNDVVNAVGVSRRTLDRRMAEVRGRSVLDEIIECRYNRATRLLRETELPLKTVAILAGFSSVQHLRRIFIDRTELTPKEYRERPHAPAMPGNPCGNARPAGD